MLLRNRNVEAHSSVLQLQSPSTLIGSNPDCDLVIKCPGVRPRHALIEFYPNTGSYWLRQLLPFEEKQLDRRQMASNPMPPPPPYPYEEEGRRNSAQSEEEDGNNNNVASRKSTREQVLQDGTIIELRSLDTLRFGRGPQAVEFTFKMPPLVGTQPKVKSRSSSSDRQNKQRARSFGGGGSRQKQQPEAEDFSLPIVGSRIQPRVHADRFARPPTQVRLCHLQQQQMQMGGGNQQQQPNFCSFQQLPNGVTMLRRSHSTSRVIAIDSSKGELQMESSSGDEAFSPPAIGGGILVAKGQQQRNNGTSASLDHNQLLSSGCSLPQVIGGEWGREEMIGIESGKVSRNQTQNPQQQQQQLLQRVLRLQAELQRRDQEISLLMAQIQRQQNERERQREEEEEGISTSAHSTSVIAAAAANNSENLFQEALARAHEENERLREELLLNQQQQGANGTGGGGKRRAMPTATQLAPPHARLNEIVYETFFKVCTEAMESLNRRLSNLPVRDYADIFAEMGKILHEPFSFRLMEVNSKCSVVFESPALQLEPSDREQLYIQFDHFLKEKIYPISKAVDSFMCTLKESASMARESAKACTVFSQWSREFGDQLQLQPNWDLMLYKVRDLQARFREQAMPKHWLPPSLMPLLEVLIFERKNWAEEQQRKQQELAQSLAKAELQIGQLEAQLADKIPLLPEPAGDADNVSQKRMARECSIPRIELPSQSNEGEPDEQQPKLMLQLQQSPRKGGRRRSSHETSADDDSPHPDEAQLNSPHTPPPSHRRMPLLGSRVAAGHEEEEEDAERKADEEEGEEKPWGDRQAEEKEVEVKEEDEKEETTDDEPMIEREEEDDEPMIEIESESGQEAEDEEEGEGRESGADEDGPEQAEAIATAIQHLNQVYDELVEQRTKSRMASPALLMANSEPERAKTAMEARPSAINEAAELEIGGNGQQRRSSMLGTAGGIVQESGHGTADESADETLVRAESEEEEDDQKGSLALLALNSVYNNLDDQRRRSTETEATSREEEGQKPIEDSGADDNAKADWRVREEKIMRAEKAILLGKPISSLPTSVSDGKLLDFVGDERQEDGTHNLDWQTEEEREFERLEREVLEEEERTIPAIADEKKPNNDEGDGGDRVEEGKTKAVEFWELIHSLAGILGVELPQRIGNDLAATTTLLHSSDNESNRLQSEGDLDARQRAVDSVLNRLQMMLDQLRVVQQQKTKRRRWKAGGKVADAGEDGGTSSSVSVEKEEDEEEEAGESVL